SGTGLTTRQLGPIPIDGPRGRASKWGLPEWFAFALVGGPAILYLPGTQRYRVLFRIGVFGVSLLGMVLSLTRPRVTNRHRAWTFLAIATVYMALMILHPSTNTTLAGLAQTCMHLAVAAPLFWAPQYFLGDYRRLARVLTIFWVLNGASAVVGIFQVRDP